MKWGLALVLLLGACSGGGGGQGDQPQDLEAAAIERGLVQDPTDTEISGLYARDTDRVCIVPDASIGYRIGAFVDYGEGITCSGSGTVTRAGQTLRVEMGKGCSFDARFDGDKISFPGALPDACNTQCARRASYAGLEVARLSESVAEAAAMRDAGGKRLCAI